MSKGISINLPHWLGKAVIWTEVKLEGEHVKAALEKTEVALDENLAHPLTAFFSTWLGAPVSHLLFSNPTITEESAAAIVKPEAQAAITGLVDAFGLIPAPEKPVAIAFLMNIFPTVFSQVFSQVAKQFKAAPATTAQADAAATTAASNVAKGVEGVAKPKTG